MGTDGERRYRGHLQPAHTGRGIIDGDTGPGPPRTRLGASSEDCVDTELGVVGGSHEAMDNFS